MQEISQPTDVFEPWGQEGITVEELALVSPALIAPQLKFWERQQTKGVFPDLMIQDYLRCMQSALKGAQLLQLARQRGMLDLVEVPDGIKEATSQIVAAIGGTRLIRMPLFGRHWEKPSGVAEKPSNELSFIAQMSIDEPSNVGIIVRHERAGEHGLPWITATDNRWFQAAGLYLHTSYPAQPSRLLLGQFRNEGLSFERARFTLVQARLSRLALQNLSS